MEEQLQHVREVWQVCAAPGDLQGVDTQTDKHKQNAMISENHKMKLYNTVHIMSPKSDKYDNAITKIFDPKIYN